jgi:uncharacterized protein YndB with AHSA1/START domain
VAIDSSVEGRVVVEVLVDASAETIFPFFTDPEKMVRWKGTRAELDPRPGGTYSVDVTHQALARGEYVELDPPTRVVFTWGWEGDDAVPPGSSTVEVTLEPQGGSTLVRLAHSGLPEDKRELHREGWEHFGARLRVAAAGGDPGPDPMLGQDNQAKWEGDADG